jgi:UDP-N-acetylmuramoyl-tripeptide--D-alanyl-D-alanine ligase
MNIEQLYQHYLDCSGVTTDSRNVPEGSLFVALQGPNFDGNQYAAEALESGAKYAVVSDPVLNGGHYLSVSDTMQTLQQLATYHRQTWDFPVLGITGSNGKTTTKELCREVLAKKYKTYATVGNLNNHIGVPLTILNMPADVEIAIIEMGANHVGEIADLCRIAQPTHGLITNIGKAHLEGFGGPEGVVKAKGELFDWLIQKDGIGLVNQSDIKVSSLGESIRHKITYGVDVEADHGGVIVIEQPSIHVEVNGQTVQTSLTGAYNAENVVAAFAVGVAFEVDDQQIQEAIESYIPTMNRSQLIDQGSNRFILDAYNANPSNMQVALANLTAMEAEKKIAILGGMKELGSYSESEHTAVARLASELRLADVILVGEEFSQVPESLGCRYFDSVDTLKPWFRAQNFEDTLFLIKGSRLIALERLLED